MNKTAKEIVWYATVAALVFAARMLDHLFTGWFSINAAIVTLAVVYICIFVRPTLLNAVLCGTVFGIMSLLTSLMFPGGFTQYFVNPLVSVLPRILVGVAVYFVYILIRKAGKKFEVPAMAAACVIGSAVNTFTVMTMIYFFIRLMQDVTYGSVIGLVIALNTLMEIIIPPVITPFAVMGIRRGMHLDGKDGGQNGAEQ